MNEYRRVNKSLGDLLRVIFKHKWKILLIFLGVTAFAVFRIMRQRPVYESAAKILVKEGRENSTPTTAIMEVPERFLDITRQEDINSEIEILRSRLLAEKVVEKLGTDLTKSSGQMNRETTSPPSAISQSLRKIFREFQMLFHYLLPSIPSPLPLTPFESAVMRVKSGLKVQPVRSSNVIRVSFSDTNPDVSVDVINTLLDFYLDQHLMVHKTPGAYQFFSDQAVDYKQKLEESEKKMEEFKKRCALGELNLQREILVRQEGNYEDDLKGVESAIDEINERIRKQKEQLADQEEKIWISETSRRNPLKDQLNSRLSQLKFRESELLNTFIDEDHRKIVDLRQEIQEVESQLAQMTDPVQAEVHIGLNSFYLQLTESILNNQTELQVLEAKKHNLNKSLADCRKKLAMLNERELQFNQLQRQIRMEEESYKLYRKKVEENRISDAMDAARFANISIIEPALRPLAPSPANEKLKIMMAILLGLTAGLGIALLAELMDHSVGSPDELESLINVPVLGSIPDLKE